MPNAQQAIGAQQTGAVQRFAGLRDNGELDLEEWQSLFTPRTRVAAFTQVSNVLGTINPAAAMTAFARERGALVLVDGAQALPHGPVDLGAIDADFYAFSGHKVFAPDGVGVLVGRREILDAMPPYQTGGDMIERVSIAGTTFRRSGRLAASTLGKRRSNSRVITASSAAMSAMKADFSSKR